MYNWYYADASNQQQGPVDSAALAAAYRDGRINADTLVWREGLVAWTKLADVAAQIGLVVVRAPARAAAPARSVAKPPSSASTWIIVLVVCVFGGVAVLGILAAIAIPAYSDYTLRARTSEAAIAGQMLKSEVEELRSSLGRCPRNGDEPIGTATSYASQNVASVTVGPLGSDDGDCAITVELASANARLAGKQLTWSLDADGDWHVFSDVDPRYLPTSIRSELE